MESQWSHSGVTVELKKKMEHFDYSQSDIDDYIQEMEIKNKLFDDILFLIEIQEEINEPY